MTTSVAHKYAAEVTRLSDAAVLRRNLRTIITHLVDLHVQGKDANALCNGVKSAVLQLHFSRVVESALAAAELIADRLRALDTPNELNRWTPEDGGPKPSRSTPTATIAADTAKATTADPIIRRIVIAQAITRAVHHGIGDGDPRTAALLRRVDRVLATQAITLQDISLDTEETSP